MKNIREFKTGSNRNSDEGKFDYEGFNSPIVDWSFAKYMHHHRKLDDGTLRDSDNWQKGIPPKELLKSLKRHMQDVNLIMRGFTVVENGKVVTLEEACNGIKFNTNGIILNELKDMKIVERNDISE